MNYGTFQRLEALLRRSSRINNKDTLTSLLMDAQDVSSRFLSKIIKTDTCWLWRNAPANQYGRFGGALAHRVSFFYFVDTVPDDKLVRHKCDNKPCVNPSHLELGTYLDNSHDHVKRGRSRSRFGRAAVAEMQRLYDIGVPIGRAADLFRISGGYYEALARGKYVPVAHSYHPADMAGYPVSGPCKACNSTGRYFQLSKQVVCAACAGSGIYSPPGSSLEVSP